MAIRSYSVSGLNPQLCTRDTKPATTISCHEDRGCCYVATYGEWHRGEGNFQEFEGVIHGCMHENTDECDCDEFVGLECRDVTYEKRLYECAKWARHAGGHTGYRIIDFEIHGSEWDEYYLRLTMQHKVELAQALLDWAHGGDRTQEGDVCVKKQSILTIDSGDNYKAAAHRPLNRWQYAQGCPETVNGYNKDGSAMVYGAVAKGSMLLATNAHFGDAQAADHWECSGDAYWFAGMGVQGGDEKTCPGPIDPHPASEPSTGGTYPQSCRNCGVGYTQFWCTCRWIAGQWNSCSGCGDILLKREVRTPAPLSHPRASSPNTSEPP